MLRRRDPLANSEQLIRRVYGYVAYRIGDDPDAEDATSETFARALRYKQSYDARVGSPQTWLLGIARRVVADHALSAGSSHLLSHPDANVVAMDEFADAALDRLSLRALCNNSRLAIAIS